MEEEKFWTIIVKPYELCSKARRLGPPGEFIRLRWRVLAEQIFKWRQTFFGGVDSAGQKQDIWSFLQELCAGYRYCHRLDLVVYIDHLSSLVHLQGTGKGFST
ncbi:UNVERIFIED_CONTAM: hypothetical protein K2H54_017173 [Gekko kuhli]